MRAVFVTAMHSMECLANDGACQNWLHKDPLSAPFLMPCT